MSKEISGIWIGERDLTRDPAFIKESQNEIQNTNLLETLGEDGVAEELESSRRDFLKLMGFGLSAATMAAGCDIPVKRAIPYVIKPEEIVPGVANYYASTYVNGGESCPVLVKTREGRPIKIEGNALSAITHGGTSARAQASVLSLYDVNRLKSPKIDGESASWDEVDDKVKGALSRAKGIRVVTHTILSPTTKKIIEQFKTKYPSTEVVTYDPVSSSALLEANEKNFGVRAIPNYRFDKANIIVSFNCDFLGTWISPVEYAAQYAKGRKIQDVHDATMSRHVQVEAHMSMTGSNADNRILVKPSEQGAAIAYLYGQIAGQSSGSSGLNQKAQGALRALAGQLQSNKGKCLIVSGSNDVNEQLLINAINDALGNYGNAVEFDGASLQRQGDERGLSALVADINSGSADVVLLHNCNPVYEYSAISGLKEALESASTRVALNYDQNETTSICNIVAPINHYLESWGDVEAKRGHLGLMQPTIHRLFDTRQVEETLIGWADISVESADDDIVLSYIRKNWEDSYFPQQEDYLSFQAFWDKALHDGVYNMHIDSNPVAYSGNASEALGSLRSPASGGIEIQFVESIGIGNGVHANNPWLQEMPDPVNRCTWGNYLAVPVGFDGVKRLLGFNGLKDGDLADLTIEGNTYRVPVIQQFGQMEGTVAISIGYGREDVGGAGRGVGLNVNDHLTVKDGLVQLYSDQVEVSRKKGKEKHYSSVQYHHTMGVTAEDKKGNTINADEAALAPGWGNVMTGYQGSLVERTIIRTSHLDHLEESVEHLKHEREHHEGLNKETLYPYEKYKAEKYSQGHHWGMHVDLNACIGCGACTVACMAENNVPVVGKKQVSRHQEMAWLRIDRYYYGDLETPNVVYQPMMCQHCDNAPCENVCPVNATNHSSEGLNQMTYNRCIGTRYCANNCPYKVRRFNWLDYTTADTFPANQVNVNNEELSYGADNLTRMVLNPDVTVRSRGVIEKCSFCVQRIQEGKLTAKTEQRKLHDADVKTACQTSCPTGAITFGDQNNKKGELHDKFESPLNMIVLEEINVRSSVMYTMKVNNRDESLDA